jgi:hypothetical protein
MAADSSVMQRWHEVVAMRDLAALDELLADDVVFQSPAVHTPQVGRALTRKYLSAAFEVLGGEGFRYVDEWSGDRSAVLEFETTLDGLQVNGVDMIHWDAAGRIVRFKVMVRPVKALQALIPRMAEALQRSG